MSTDFALLDLNTTDLLIILAIAVLLFGGKKLPELSRGIGQSIKEVRKALAGTAELKDEMKSQIDKTKEAVSNKAPKA